MRTSKHILMLVMMMGLLLSSVVYGQPAAGTVISNQATATYNDPTGATLNTVSAIVNVTIAAVAGVQVTPDETTPSVTYGPLEDHERTFQICNSGNTANSFITTLVSVGSPGTFQAAYYDTNNDGIYNAGDTAVTLSSTQTPSLAPGTCQTLIVLFNTGNALANATYAINVTAQSVTPGVNGTTTDAGQRSTA
jgi:trimeric autotransporter adhesin